MKTILEIVNFFNDQKVYIKTEDKEDFTFVDLKKQIDFLLINLNHSQKVYQELAKVY